MSKGYGKWIRDSVASPGLWCWSSMPPTKSPEATRELAAELLAWADAHDTVTLVVPKQTAEWYADDRKLWFSDPGDYPTSRNGRIVGEAARKALGMEP